MLFTSALALVKVVMCSCVCGIAYILRCDLEFGVYSVVWADRLWEHPHPLPSSESAAKTLRRSLGVAEELLPGEV